MAAGAAATTGQEGAGGGGGGASGLQPDFAPLLEVIVVGWLRDEDDGCMHARTQAFRCR